MKRNSRLGSGKPWLILLAALSLVTACAGAPASRVISVHKSPERTFSLDGVNSSRPGLVQALERALAGRTGLTQASPAEARFVLIGDLDLKLEETSGRELVKTETKTDRLTKVELKDPFLDKEYTVVRPVVETSATQVPFVQRAAFLRIEFRLKTKDGSAIPQTLTMNQIKKYGGLNEYRGPTMKDLPSPQETIGEIVEKMAERLAIRLAPDSVDWPLDSGGYLSADPDLADSLELAGAGDWSRAEALWRKILKVDPEHPVAGYNLAVALMRQGGTERLKEARDLLAKAVKNGNNPLYRQAWSEVALRLKEYNGDR